MTRPVDSVRTTRFETTSKTATEYLVGPGAISDERVLSTLADRPVAIVIDEAVAALHGGMIDELVGRVMCVGSLTVPGGEPFKGFDLLQHVLSFLHRSGVPKHGVVVAVGGGAVSDVVALSAMLMRRGIGLALVPTTLLAQVDSAIGGKNGINFEQTKNLLGHFYQPLIVACDQRFLTSLSPRAIACGIAESIKLFAVWDGRALSQHAATWRTADRISDLSRWRDLIWDAARWKLDLLAEDPYERSSRRLLNYGHAFAHLLEEKSAYRLLHGEAVMLGMMLENDVSYALGVGDPGSLDELGTMIVELLTPACREYWLPFRDIRDDIDKVRHMRRGMMNLVCLVAPGKARIVDDVADDTLEAAWRRVERQVRSQASPLRT